MDYLDYGEQIEQQTWRDYMRAARKARDARLLEEKCVRPLLAWHLSEPLILPNCASALYAYR